MFTNEQKQELEKIIISWESRIKESLNSPSRYVRGISVGMRICQEELIERMDEEELIKIIRDKK